MAKKNREGQPKKKARWTDLIAFLALLLSVILFLAGPILNHFGGSLLTRIASITTTVANVLMVLALALPAWYFARRRGVVFKIIYFVCLIVFIVGIVLGYTL